MILWVLGELESRSGYRLISDLWSPEQLGPSRDTALLEVRASLSGRVGKWNDAAADYARLIELAPTDHWLCHQYAPVLVMTGDLDGYRQLCRRILARSASSKEVGNSQQIAADCLLLPPSGEDLPTVAHLAEVAARTAGVNQQLPSNCPGLKRSKRWPSIGRGTLPAECAGRKGR